ncbi:MAG: hypothetical protein HY875_03905 [Chloroflexi bacterium]|nr:hypothetical protein [Chloroflexota bacterium]
MSQAEQEGSAFIVPEWMRWASDRKRLVLVGQRCRACGIAFFPKTARCKACYSAEVVEAEFGPEAELHSVTIDHTGTFLGRPHLVGQVRLDDGPFAQGFVDAGVDAEPAIGSRVDLVPFSVPALQGTGTLTTYAFRPKE